MKCIYLVIGGPGFGKTSVVKELQARGYYCIFDPCTAEFFKESMEKLGTRDTHNLELNRAVLNKRVSEYLNAPENEVCFSDRGIPDSLAYLLGGSVQVPQELWDKVRQHPYMPVVFVTPPWRKILVQDEHRHEQFEEALQVHRAILKLYRGLSYKLVELPKLSVKQRADFILRRISRG